jgi:hypothetical protein
MQEIYMMVKDNDLEALAQVTDDLSFLIDQSKLTKAFEEVNKTFDEVEHSCYALSGTMKELITRNLEDLRAEIAEQTVEPEMQLRVDQAEQSEIVVNAPSQQQLPDTTAAPEPPKQLL